MNQPQQIPQTEKHATGGDLMSIFTGGGEMGALMRAYDWDNHPLGSPVNWPQSLKTNIRLLLNSGFPMFIWWSDDLYAFHNDAYLPALGEKHPQALGQPAKQVWAEIWEQLEGIVKNILNGGDYFYTEALLLMLERKGFREETYWTFSYSPVFDDDGKINGIFCACTEVTNTVLNQRRLKTLKDVSGAFTQAQTLEEACKVTCDTLNGISQDIPFSMIYLLNASGTKAQLKAHAGKLPVDAAAPVIDMTKPESPQYWMLAKVQRTRKLEVIDLRPLDSFAQLKNAPHHAAVVPVFKPGQDELIGFFISGISPELEYNAEYQSFHELLSGQIATSINSVQVREELARQKEFLIELFQQAPVAITILHGPDYVVELANQSMCELWGRTPKDVLGQPVLDAIPEAKEQGIKQLLDSVLYTGVPYINNELPLMLQRNGKMEKVYVNFVYHPMRNAQGEITGIIAVAISINEQVEARHKIEDINKELLAINADLDNFVYSASHDLKAPISNIEGLVHALMDYLPSETMETDVVKNLIDHILSSIERFKRAVADLSQVAKIQREAGEDIQNIDLAEVVEEVRLDFAPIISTSDAYVETSFAKNSIVRFSAKNVRSIVYNLLSNALKYRSPERQPYIRITTENTPEFVVLSVSDNGLGIDLSKKSKIFSMFKRLHDHVEGTGIGLYIVKRIVENAGGKIEVESEVGKGTTFRVYFRH